MYLSIYNFIYLEKIDRRSIAREIKTWIYLDLLVLQLFRARQQTRKHFDLLETYKEKRLLENRDCVL